MGRYAGGDTPRTSPYGHLHSKVALGSKIHICTDDEIRTSIARNMSLITKYCYFGILGLRLRLG